MTAYIMSRGVMQSPFTTFAALRTGRQTMTTPADDDASLIQRVVAKDRQAFETLYMRYAPRLSRYLSTLLHDAAVVEEVLDDVLLVVWQQAARFNAQSQVSTWIFGIAYYKALKARARKSGLPPDLPPPPSWRAEDDPATALQQQDTTQTLLQALATLSPEQRSVVELTFYHGYSYQEIAELTRCPVNTVKTRMFAARRRLAQWLTDLGWGNAGTGKEAEA